MLCALLHSSTMLLSCVVCAEVLKSDDKRSTLSLASVEKPDKICPLTGIFFISSLKTFRKQRRSVCSSVVISKLPSAEIELGKNYNILRYEFSFFDLKMMLADLYGPQNWTYSPA